MSSYGLDNDEAVILQASGVRTSSGAVVDLILTNKCIIQVNTGYRGKDIGSIIFQLTDLKVLDGKPNVRIGKNRSGKKQLELYFDNYKEAYILKGFMAESNWVKEINRAYKKRLLCIKKENNDELSFVESIKDKLLGDDNGLRVVHPTHKCPKCGAELFGSKGDEIKCEYCETLVRIK